MVISSKTEWNRVGKKNWAIAPMSKSSLVKFCLLGICVFVSVFLDAM